MLAVLVELADDSHGAERGRWSIETLFGLESRTPGSFSSAGEAADWVSDQAGSNAFAIGEEIEWLQ